jgi:hypothetical protein
MWGIFIIDELDGTSSHGHFTPRDSALLLIEQGAELLSDSV